ncbi:Cysteine synthase (EC [Kosakonia radicincitans]|nr:Cysteine synthase (EC [Kosakonia radicincitans]
MTGDITDSIGNTPLMEILKDRQFNSHLYVKLESFNPGGSILN